MKVCLINPNSTLATSSRRYRKFVPPVPPLGIAYIAGILEKNGIEVVVIDQYANKKNNEELISDIRKPEPQIIGISCLTAAMDNVCALSEKIRMSLKDTKVVLGNIHASIFADDLLKQGIGDIVVRGEGEYSMLEAVAAVEKGDSLRSVKGISFIENGVVRHNPEREIVDDLDSLPYPAWHLFDLSCYRGCARIALHNKLGLPVIGSRGCPYKCVFCSQDRLYNKPRYRKTQSIVDEMEYLYERFKVDFIGFHDPYFPFSIKQGFNFCDEIDKRGLSKKIKWFTETRVDKVDIALLKRMKESGLHLIFYGFESGNQEVLDKAGKNFTIKQAQMAMSAAKSAKIIVHGLFMLGLPGETKETCEDTIRFAKELDPEICKFNVAVPYPGSSFFEKYRKKLNGQNNVKFTSWYDWSGLSGSLIYTPEGMTSDELISLQRKAMFEFYMRPKLILRHLKITPFNDLCYGAWILLYGYITELVRKILKSKG